MVKKGAGIGETGMRIGAVHTLDVDDYRPDAETPHIDMTFGRRKRKCVSADGFWTGFGQKTTTESNRVQYFVAPEAASMCAHFG